MRPRIHLRGRFVSWMVASKGVQFVVGHFCSGSSIPTSRIYERADILKISLRAAGGLCLPRSRLETPALFGMGALRKAA
jgi:ABC-type branched-subunit amino acid transport system substrate-binding protein